MDTNTTNGSPLGVPINGPPETLLERAQRAPKGRLAAYPENEQHVQLAIAFVRGEVTSTQCAAAIGLSSHQSAVQRMWTVFRRAVLAGRVTVTDNSRVTR